MRSFRWLVGGPGPALAPDVLRQPCRRGFRSTLTPLTLQTQQETLSLSRCITGPSDILYLPDGWAHATCGLSTFNVGLGYIGSVGFLPPLHRAAVVGDLPTVSERLEVEGISVLEPAGGGMLNEAGLPPLHWAAWNGHVEVMRKLIEWEPQAAAVRHVPSLASALRWAAARGHSSATAFLAKEIGPDVRDEQGAPAVRQRCAHSELLSVQCFYNFLHVTIATRCKSFALGGNHWTCSGDEGVAETEGQKLLDTSTWPHASDLSVKRLHRP